MINPAIEHWPMQKTIRGFTIIRPAATFSLREKECSATFALLRVHSRLKNIRLAKREAPEGGHERARGVSPGYDVPKKTNKPRRGGTKTNMDGQDEQDNLGRGGTRPSRDFGRDPKRRAAPHSTTLARTPRLPLPAGEGRGEGERVGFVSSLEKVCFVIQHFRLG